MHSERGSDGTSLKSIATLPAVLVLALAACGGESSRDWGPLAVQSPQTGGLTSRIQGVVIVSGTCVHLLTQGGKKLLLVWDS